MKPGEKEGVPPQSLKYTSREKPGTKPRPSGRAKILAQGKEKLDAAEEDRNAARLARFKAEKDSCCILM